MSYALAYYYTVKKRVVVPTVRDFGGSGQGDGCEGRFSWLDAYAAELVGILRRAGLAMKILRKVQPLLERLIGEQTSGELESCGRS
jgi:hypothetical protein